MSGCLIALIGGLILPAGGENVSGDFVLAGPGRPEARLFWIDLQLADLTGNVTFSNISSLSN